MRAKLSFCHPSVWFSSHTFFACRASRSHIFLRDFFLCVAGRTWSEWAEEAKANRRQTQRQSHENLFRFTRHQPFLSFELPSVLGSALSLERNRGREEKRTQFRNSERYLWQSQLSPLRYHHVERICCNCVVSESTSRTVSVTFFSSRNPIRILKPRFPDRIRVIHLAPIQLTHFF
jgi:hypothetical protein